MRLERGQRWVFFPFFFFLVLARLVSKEEIDQKWKGRKGNGREGGRQGEKNREKKKKKATTYGPIMKGSMMSAEHAL